ncbi:hypothetical protein JOB18_024353 [Solea senegalensis]|uniref:Uncharacterized protein n=1 Tax=Solea senegalensis TaxID=28829 RepID=A0AAV6R194_SOLSE|nr:hypothetical protein JOB18_024353 [Solea senegalensis]
MNCNHVTKAQHTTPAEAVYHHDVVDNGVVWTGDKIRLPLNTRYRLHSRRLATTVCVRLLQVPNATALCGIDSDEIGPLLLKGSYQCRHCQLHTPRQKPGSRLKSEAD